VLQRPGLRIGYVPQHMQRDPVLPMTVARFMTLGAPAPRTALQQALDEVGADPILGHPLAEISGGEMQRVLLARALLREPQLLVLDEPLAGVDVTSQSDLYRLIADIRDRRGCGVLLVSHDLHLVMAATDAVVCLNRHVCCTGRPQTVLRNPEFISLFGPHLSETLAVYQHSHDHRHDALGEPLSLEADSGKDFTNFNTAVDVEGALTALSGNEKPEPRQMSERLSTAKERVKEYENRAWSGQSSIDVFGSPTNTSLGTNAVSDPESFLQKYKMNFLANQQSKVKPTEMNPPQA